jgi:hypothetical protein
VREPALAEVMAFSSLFASFAFAFPPIVFEKSKIRWGKAALWLDSLYASVPFRF